MCLNAWGGRLPDRLLPYLETVAPDVLCLQEVVATPASPRPWLTYRDGDHVLEQRADLMGEVAAALPQHRAMFCPASRGALWDGAEPVWSQFGIATFVRASLAVVGQAQAFVHGAFSPDDFGEHPRPRSAHAVRVHEFETGRTVSIAHMHGLRIPGDKSDSPERLAQARRFADLIARTAEDGDLVVACGDFNVEPQSQTFEILAELGLTDLVTTRRFSGTRTSFYEKTGRFADYMLVGADTRVARFDVVEQPEVSDHRPLLLEI